MRKFSKALAVAAAVVTIGGASAVALAQTGPGYGPGGYGGYWCGSGYGPGSMPGWGGGYGMMGAWGGGYADPAARLGSLKTDLALRPDQTAAWDAYAKAVTDGSAQLRALRNSFDFAKFRAMPWQEHWAYMGQFHDKQAAVFQSIQTARDALAAKLDDSQKSRLLSNGPGYYGRGFGGGYGGGPWMMGPGYGMMGPGYGMMWGWGGGYR